MWSNFLMQEENRRRAEAGRRGRGQGLPGLSQEQEGKVKLLLLLTTVGATLAVLAVGTEFWVELNTFKANGSAVCDAAHLGLWKMCTKRLWQADVPAGRETCGPAELPGGEASPRLGPQTVREPRWEKRVPRDSPSPREGACTLANSQKLHQSVLPSGLCPRHRLCREGNSVPQTSLCSRTSMHPQTSLSSRPACVPREHLETTHAPTHGPGPDAQPVTPDTACALRQPRSRRCPHPPQTL